MDGYRQKGERATANHEFATVARGDFGEGGIFGVSA